MNKKKVLHIENSTHLTGAFKALIGVCNEIRNEYHSIIALPKQSVCNEILDKENISWIKFSFLELRKSIKALLLYLPFLMRNTLWVKRYIQKNGISIIHANDHFNLVPVFVKMLLGSKIKLVVHVRLLPSTYNHQLYSLFRQLNTTYGDKLIAVSESILEAYKKPEKMVMIRDKIVLAEQLAPYKPQQSGIFKFVYISNYIQGKGQNFAIEAFLKIADKNPTTQLHFYGDVMGLEKNIQYKNDLIHKVGNSGLQKQIFFNGFASDTEAVYKQYDASLCFSESESFSLICIESQFYGIPIIASASGGPQEIIQNMQNGILVENRNVSEMAEAMQALLNNFTLRKTLSDAGKLRAREIMNSTPSFLSVLKQL